MRRTHQAAAARRSLSLGILVIALFVAPQALAQEVSPPPSPPPPAETPLITGNTLFALMMAVVILGIGLLALIVWKISAGKDPEQKGSAYRPLIEGMVLVMVVVALIILGITGKITAEGLASVLAAIIGYAVGRSTSVAADNSTGRATTDTSGTGGGGGGAATGPSGGGTQTSVVPATQTGDEPLLSPVDVSSESYIEFSQEQLDRLADPQVAFEQVREEGDIERSADGA